MSNVSLETEKQQCKDTAAVGHLADLSKTNLGSARKLAMFVDESAPEMHANITPKSACKGRDAFKWDPRDQQACSYIGNG